MIDALILPEHRPIQESYAECCIARQQRLSGFYESSIIYVDRACGNCCQLCCALLEGATCTDLAIWQSSMILSKNLALCWIAADVNKAEVSFVMA